MLKVLLVEDNLADARLLQKFLSKVEKEHFQLMSVECTSDAITCLHQNPFDVILLDLSLPDSQGLETVKQVYNAAPYVPIVVLTGLDDEYTATEALREGAQDYLLKDEIRPDSLVRAIHYAIERQQILDEVRQLNEKLIRSNKELEQFAYVVSHDLQQPLQNIISFAELLAYQYQGRLDKKADLYLNFIVKAGVKMGQLIKDLLAYSRIGMSNHPVEEPTDAHRVFQLVLNNLQIAIAESKAIITADPLPTVMINEIQLTQLLQNFITNAIKYHRPGIAPQIHISVKKQGNEWLFGIHDNGMGIDAQDFERIFEMFQRLSPDNDSTGTGIGLAICQKIVEYHGGSIWVESKPGVGSDFYFTLMVADI